MRIEEIKRLRPIVASQTDKVKKVIRKENESLLGPIVIANTRKFVSIIVSKTNRRINK